jgi:hypothetical protein
MPGLKVLSVRITTKQLEDQAVTTAKLADDSVTSTKIADGQVATADIADSAVTTPKLADSVITAPKVNDDFFQAGLDAIDSIESWIVFPKAFPTEPYVVTQPVTGVSTIKVTSITTGSFAWVGDVAGSAIWLAFRKA